MITILNSKLLVPDASEAVPRERLNELTAEIPRKKLTTVIAGAGYGKTTLVAQAVGNSNWKTVWYRLGETDRDLVTFASYLIAGFKKLDPAFGRETELRMVDIPRSKKANEEILISLIGEMEKRIGGDLSIVLEDFHLVQGNREISRALEFLIENQPRNLHIILISRLEPEILLSRLRSTRQIVEIKSEEMAFTDRETEQFCRKLFGISLNHGILETLRQKTEGWVTGLVLYYHAAKGLEKREIEKGIVDLKGSSAAISSYLQENTFESLSESTRDFLLKTSLLSRLDADFIDEYLETDNSREILSGLVKSQLFTFALDDDGKWFCYHHLFQEFLYDKLRHQCGRKAVRNS